MRALIFAAGRGERMRPLTTHTPKPLLEVGGKRLIEWQIEALARADVREIVVNVAHLAEQFEPALGDGARYGVTLHYSREGDEPLETGGGLLHALPLLGDEPFLAVNGDVYVELDYAALAQRTLHGDAHLVLIDNPAHHPRGDFVLDGDRVRDEPIARDETSIGESVRNDRGVRRTFAGIGLYRASVLAAWREVIGDTPGARLDPPRFPLAPLLRAAMKRERVTGEHHAGPWVDVGTVERLQQLDAALRARSAI
jgi:N-acetyl-alpha-D-muramate 1-phosphate uridylyltransferase